MYIVHVGSFYFPKGNAAVQRIRFTYKTVQAAGFSPLVINKECYETSPQKRTNKFEGIPYVYTSSSLYRPSNKVSRKLNHFSGVIGELKLLFKRRKKIASIVLYNTSSFTELLYYRFISKLLGFKLVFQYVEYRSSFEKDSFTARLNDKIFDNYCSYFTDGAIVISEFLKEKIQQKNNKLPFIKIPAICDFKDFEVVPPANHGYNYFLYCGTAEYRPVIEFIIDLYEKIRDRQLYNGNLQLIIGGHNPNSLIAIKERIKANKYSNNIVMLSGISYNDLIANYKGADLLLIPLRNSIQDTARFPQKISEYTAAGKAVLSTNIGELKYYFEDGKSAILASEYTTEAYIQSLEKVLKEEGKLKQIGEAGYKTGYNNFHYLCNTEAVKTFFVNLCKLEYTKKMAIAGA